MTSPLTASEAWSILGIDAVIPIGGDDTLSFAERLHCEGFPVIAIPKTMDNDVFGTDYCIGFSTAVTRGLVSFMPSGHAPALMKGLRLLSCLGVIAARHH